MINLLLKEIFAEDKFVEIVMLSTSKSITIKPYAICQMPGKVIHQKDREVLSDLSKILNLNVENLRTPNKIIHRLPKRHPSNYRNTTRRHDAEGRTRTRQGTSQKAP